MKPIRNAVALEELFVLLIIARKDEAGFSEFIPHDSKQEQSEDRKGVDE